MSDIMLFCMQLTSSSHLSDFQALAIIAFNHGELNLNTFKTLLSIGPTFAVMNFVESKLFICCIILFLLPCLITYFIIPYSASFFVLVHFVLLLLI